MTGIIADISVSLDGWGRFPATPATAGAPRTLVQRSVIPAPAAMHLTCDVFR